MEFVDELEQAGIPDRQARAISSAVRKSHEALDVVTKADLQHLEERVDAKLDKLEMRLDARFSNMKFELLKS